MLWGIAWYSEIAYLVISESYILMETFIKQWSNRTVHVNTKDQPITPSNSIHIGYRINSNFIFYFFVSFSAFHFLYRCACVWIRMPWGSGGIEYETAMQRLVRTLRMLVTHGRQSILLLWGFPATENCLLQWMAQSFCDIVVWPSSLCCWLGT